MNLQEGAMLGLALLLVFVRCRRFCR